MIKRIYHHHSKWEDWLNGMWRKTTPVDHVRLLEEAVKFTGDHVLYGGFMMRVIREWPYSCEQNLSDTGMNRQAWIGHAACCLAIKCPEYITREAWWHLTKEQQDSANAMADKAIGEWEKNFIEKEDGCLRLNLG